MSPYEARNYRLTFGAANRKILDTVGSGADGRRYLTWLVSPKGATKWQDHPDYVEAKTAIQQYLSDTVPQQTSAPQPRRAGSVDWSQRQRNADCGY